MKHLEKYSFHPSIFNQSAGNFKVWLKNRYPKLKADEVKYLIDKNYGKDGDGSGIKKESKPVTK